MTGFAKCSMANATPSPGSSVPLAFLARCNVLIDVEHATDLVKSFDFKTLFLEDLGWDHAPATVTAVKVDDRTYTLRPIAEKRGVQVLECVQSNGEIPPYRVRQSVDREVRMVAHEHLIIFTDHPRSTQIWQWVAREPGKSAAYREHTYTIGQSGLSLVQRLASIAFPLSEE